MNEQTVQMLEEVITSGVSIEHRDVIEGRYPSRMLPEGAIVTRSAPSPTGFVHIGTIYMCLLNQFFARQTGGVYMLRVEDTDKKREISDGIAQIVDALSAFDLVPQEGVRADGTSYGAYGPYLQSERKSIYLTYAVELLRSGRAYPCFATKEELDAAYKEQQAAKVRPGYYGQWALWRNKSNEDVLAALDAGLPFVLRFRSKGSHEKRIVLKDRLKGTIELPENDLDVPLIKADGSQLPTYHLAHVVDDHLMRSTIILRGDEWLPSTPLHVELAQALGIQPFTYAHFAPISVLDKNGGGKRKLSKRKDPEADVNFWLYKTAYPIQPIKAYLLGLANSQFEEWYRQHPNEPLESFELTLDKLAASRAPLLDIQKLEDYSKEYIANLPLEDFEVGLKSLLNPEFNQALETAPKEYVCDVLSIERTGEKRRKDIAKWSDGPDQYGYFFDELFEKNFKNQGRTDYLAAFSSETVTVACKAFLETHNPTDDQPTWFEKVKSAAELCGFATDNKAYKEDTKLPPEQRIYVGNTADFAKILRVCLTGKDRTPDLYTIMQVMGEQRVRSRLTLT